MTHWTKRFLKWGDYQNFKVIWPKEMPILVRGRGKLINFDNLPIFKIHKWLLLFLFLLLLLLLSIFGLVSYVC